MFDVIIVGAGTAGLGALREARKHTQSFAIINDGPWGTMCARVGCMPSKALIQAAHEFHARHRFAELGIPGSEQLGVDVAAVLARVRKIRDELVDETLALTRDLGDRAISGRARLLGPDALTVNGVEMKAHRIILATGSRPIVPDAWKPFADSLLTTDSLFEQTTLPHRLAVLGLGGVGTEMAQALARLGLHVTAFHDKALISGLSDSHVNTTLLEALRRELTVHLGHEAELFAADDGVRVKAGPEEVAVDRVLVALGRRPNLDALGLETLGVALDEHGKPAVDRETMQIGDLPVFLVGDAHGDARVQHEASDEGHIAGINAATRSFDRFERRTPLSIVFCDPNVAIVGQRVGQLDPEKTVVGEASFEHQGRARLMLQKLGAIRVYADHRDGTILGAELCAPAGEHLAHLLALAIHRRSTVREMLRAPFYHPSLEEGLRTALRDAAKHLPSEAFELARVFKPQ